MLLPFWREVTFDFDSPKNHWLFSVSDDAPQEKASCDRHKPKENNFHVTTRPWIDPRCPRVRGFWICWAWKSIGNARTPRCWQHQIKWKSLNSLMHYLSGGKWKTGLFFKKQLIRKIKINETVFQKVMTVEFWKHPRIWSNIKFRLITDLLSLTKHRHKVLIICCTNSRKNILLFGPYHCKNSGKKQCSTVFKMMGFKIMRRKNLLRKP